MEWAEYISDINYWAVLLAIVASFALGMTWYSMRVFGKTWMKEEGLSKKEMDNKEGMMKAMVASAVATAVSATSVGVLLIATGTSGFVDGTIFGAALGFTLVAASVVTHDVFGMRSSRLTFINGLYDVIQFAVIGAIMGAFL